MKNYKKKPKMDAKFNTRLHDYGRKAHKMTPKQRKEYRQGQGIALSMTPIGRATRGLVGASKGLSRASRTFSSTPSKQLKNWDVVGKWDPSKTMTFKAPSKTKAVAMDLAKFNKPNMKKKKTTRPPLNERKEMRAKPRERMLGTKKGAPGTDRRVPRTINGKTKPEAPLQNGKELKPIMIKPNMGRIVKPMSKFPDLSGDGKVTKKDILMGRGVIDKPKMTFDGDKNNKKLQEALKNATVLDNVEFGLNQTDIQTGSALESLRDAVKRRREKGGLEGAAESRARFDKARGLFEGSNIAPGSLTANADGSVTFRLKDMIDVPGMGKKRVGGRYIMDSEGNISHQAGKKYAPSPYFSKIGIKPNMKKDTPKRTQIKKTGRELQNALIKEQNKPVTKQNKNYINQLKGGIEEQRKQLRTNKTKPTMIKKKAKMTKPKMFSGTGSARMTAKEKLAAAKKAKRAPGKAVRDARKGVRTENKNKRVAARATAKSARRATRAKNLKGRIENKKARVTKRVTKSRATNKLNKLNKPAIRKPKMSYKKKK